VCRWLDPAWYSRRSAPAVMPDDPASVAEET
jgi:hypothetical protein